MADELRMHNRMNVGDKARLIEGPGPWGIGVVDYIYGDTVVVLFKDGLRTGYPSHRWRAVADDEPDIFPPVTVNLNDIS